MREACGWRVGCLNTTPIPTTTNRCVTRPSSKPTRGSKCCLPMALIPPAPTHRRAPWTSTTSERRRCCSRRRGSQRRYGAAPLRCPDFGHPALHQAAQRICSGAVAQWLLDHGADATAVTRGQTPYAYAHVYGNQASAQVLEEAGAATSLSPVEAQLARAADGDATSNDRINMADLSEEFRHLLCRMV